MSVATPLHDEYELVRLSYHARLPGDWVRLSELADELSCARETPMSVFEAIEELAHKVRGAAAVFGETRLSEAAKVLELATIEARVQPATQVNPGIANAIELLRTALVSAGGIQPGAAWATPVTKTLLPRQL